MSWSPHITDCCNETRRLIGLLYRRFNQHSNSATLINLYRSFIRPHLEYASIVWNPSFKGDIATIKNVQKFALRMCTKSWGSNYEDLLAAMNLPSLETRACLCHLFKIVRGITEFADARATWRFRSCRFDLAKWFSGLAASPGLEFIQSCDDSSAPRPPRTVHR